jgi:hypothetical protein
MKNASDQALSALVGITGIKPEFFKKEKQMPQTRPYQHWWG